jgi:hypothetical protein
MRREEFILFLKGVKAYSLQEKQEAGCFPHFF